MTKDYAKNRKTKHKKMPAGWVWLFMGTFLGCFISVLFFLGKIYPKAPHFLPEIASESHPEKPATAIRASEKEKPKFTFYTDLAELKSMAEEIDAFFPKNHSTKQKPIIPFTAPIDPETLEKADQAKIKKDSQNSLTLSEETYINQNVSAKKPLPKQETNQTTEKKPVAENSHEPHPTPTQTAKIGTPTRYSLQAGSFRLGKEADRRRAELLMLGFSAQIQTVSLSNGETYHRVVIFLDNEKQLKQTEEKLNKHNIATKAQSIN